MPIALMNRRRAQKEANPITISAVGSLVSGSSAYTATVYHLSVSPVSVGDLFMVGAITYPAQAIQTLSSGGVTTWNHIGLYNGGGTGVDLWWGAITTSGSSTLSATYASAPSGAGIVAREFSKGSGTWAVDGSEGTKYPAATTFTLPSLIPSAAGELYWSISYSGEALSSGSTTGYTYTTSSSTGIGGNLIEVYNPKVPGGPQAPTVDQAGTYNSICASILMAA
ncbi:MAG TPA: hypothetical protein VMR95_00600 [Candidatus Binatia bacterium]|nr:hypothetical protein [Candidatus Binatia bacterium]